MSEEDKDWEDQREAMYNGWKQQEKEKQSKCTHQWNTVDPIYCMKCALLKKDHEQEVFNSGKM